MTEDGPSASGSRFRLRRRLSHHDSRGQDDLPRLRRGAKQDGRRRRAVRRHAGGPLAFPLRQLLPMVVFDGGRGWRRCSTDRTVLGRSGCIAVIAVIEQSATDSVRLCLVALILLLMWVLALVLLAVVQLYF